MHHIDNPIFRACQAYVSASPVRMHMPGHKGRPDFMPPEISLDLTELKETGSATEYGDDVFSAAFTEASKLYGTSATVYSAAGSTLALQAAIKLAAGMKPVFACFRSIHRSAVNAMALLGIDPVWIYSPDEIPHDAAVIVTSPDYYGRMADIASLSALTHERNGILIVDGAHGAHLWFYGGGYLHPLKKGADFVAESLHKTLPALTGSALLHAAKKDVTADDCLSAMRLFCSTSPSYLINLSSEACLYRMSRSGDALLSGLLRRTEDFISGAEPLGYHFLRGCDTDPFRITIRTKDGRRLGKELSERGVVCEFSDSGSVVLIPSVSSTEEDFRRLTDACLDLTELSSPPQSEDLSGICDIPAPEKAMTLREAVLSPHETVRTAESAGRICCEAATPYPPGVPVVMPGEIISTEAAEILSRSGIDSVRVTKHRQ